MGSTAKIIDGKLLSEKLRNSIKTDSEAFLQKHGRAIGLAVILVGEDPASQIYVRNKIAACEKTGIKSFEYRLDADTDEKTLIELIESVNEDKSIDGLLVQLPLPKHLNEKKILSLISPDKDVDGFHAVNAGNLMLGNDCLTACTPSGVIELIKETGVEICGKNAVVVGRSNIVGKPAALLLLQHNATVTVCHSRTADLKSHTLNADILVAAVGIKEFISGDMIKPGAVVIDVGMNRYEGKLYGDVNFPEASEVAGHITPVPGGVGPMTITMLLMNTVKAANKREG